MKVKMHRFVLAEFNTHRVFSRNSASSRAIPLEKQLAKLADGPAYPISWPAEQPGMQGGSELQGADLIQAQGLAERIYEGIIEEINSYVETLDLTWGEEAKGHRVHKSVINRFIEPFMYHEAIVTADEWENFFSQRCSPLAQPEIRVVAEDMRAAYNESEPAELVRGQWHLPLIRPEDHAFVVGLSARTGIEPMYIFCAIAVARCARVSYLTHDGVRDPLKDIDLFNNLISANPPHWSPLEHVATPAEAGENPLGNFDGWDQMRHTNLWGKLAPINKEGN